MLAILVSLLAAAAAEQGTSALPPPAPEPAEPGLVETQEAAASVAAGPASDDASRTARDRHAHWAPQLRGELLGKDDARSRAGEFRLAPLRENDLGASRGWALTLTWDFSQVIFAREEGQLALAHAHLARLRREVESRAAQLWIERRQAKALWLTSRQPAACLALLQLSAQLDALTAGLFRDAVSREEAACNSEEKR